MLIDRARKHVWAFMEYIPSKLAALIYLFFQYPSWDQIFSVNGTKLDHIFRFACPAAFRTSFPARKMLNQVSKSEFLSEAALPNLDFRLYRSHVLLDMNKFQSKLSFLFFFYAAWWLIIVWNLLLFKCVCVCVFVFNECSPKDRKTGKNFGIESRAMEHGFSSEHEICRPASAHFFQ